MIFTNKRASHFFIKFKHNCELYRKLSVLTEQPAPIASKDEKPVMKSVKNDEILPAQSPDKKEINWFVVTPLVQQTLRNQFN